LGCSNLIGFVDKFAKRITDFLSQEHLEDLAREVGFVHRKSKVRVDDFIRMLLYNELDSGSVSLNDHCCDLQMHHGVSISKQAMDKKFGPSSVAFLQKLLEEQLDRQILQHIDIEIFFRFSSVKIKDSIRWQLPDHLKDYYPGSGGAASGAGMHTQFEFDLLSGKVNELQIHNGLYQDGADARQTVDSVEKGSLILRDLGYFDKKVFGEIMSKDAYFLSRLKPKTLLYVLQNGKKEKLCLEAIYKKLQYNQLEYMEVDVFLDKEATNPVRLIVEPIPDEEFEKRMRKAGREATKKKRVLSKKYKNYARLGLYVTNIPRTWVPIAHIRSLYRLRWQIELRFKAFKSHCKLAKMKKMKKHRMECYLFANLLHIMLNWQIAVGFFAVIWQNLGKTMSILKFFKTIEAHKQLQNNALKNTELMRDYLLDLYKTAAEKLLTEKKKNKLSMEKIFTISI
jgi:hypothetical protein